MSLKRFKGKARLLKNYEKRVVGWGKEENPIKIDVFTVYGGV